MNVENFNIAVQALLAAAPLGWMQITNLNKALFYLDLVCLRDHGEPFTGARFVALPHGPVVDGYKSLFTKGVPGLRVDEVSMFGMTSIRLSLDVEPPKLEPWLKDLTEKVAQMAATQRATELSELSHRNLGWLAAHERGVGTPLNMVVAMQQVLDDDDWVVEPLTADEVETLRARDRQAMVAL